MAVVAVRTTGLRVLSYDVQLEALRMLADRRDELSKTRVQAANRLHRLLAELVPGQSKRNITTVKRRLRCDWSASSEAEC